VEKLKLRSVNAVFIYEVIGRKKSRGKEIEDMYKLREAAARAYGKGR
jgi:hypothetical protein